MDNLFEEDGLPYSEEEPEPANSSVPNDRDAISRLTFNLRRCGVNQRLRNDILEELLERLTNSPSRLLCLDDTLEVDEFLWNLTVVLLQQDPNCENIVNVLENWSIHKKKANLEKTKTGNHDEIYIYNVTKDIPSIVYCKNKKKFSREFIQGATTLVSEIRYQLVLEKTKAVHPDVLPVDAISRVTKGEQVLVGVIGLDKKGELCLQGFLSELRMILDDATVLQSGIYCEGSTVIVRCLVEPYKDAIRCIEVTHPPMHVDIELPDFFGGRLTHNDHRVLEMAMAQKVKAGISEQWIIISDVHLDNDATIKMLEDVFNTFLAMYQHQGFPVGFVLMGNFTSTEFGTVKSSHEHYMQGFERMNKLLALPKFRILLMSCYFVIVPGPGDATICNQLLPEQPLITDFTSNIKDRIDNLLGNNSRFFSTTNPCRIRHLIRKMVFCRGDLVNTLLNSSIFTSGSGKKITSPSELKEMLITTILGQGHLCPNKPGANSVLRHDAALLLYPAPDIIFICDTSCPSFIWTSEKTTFCNVESFSQSKSFLCYDATSGKCQKLAV